MKKKIFVLLLAICVIFTFSACNNEEEAPPAEEETANAIINEGDPLIFAILPDTQSVPIAMANSLGYFEEEGVEVQVDLYASAMDRDAAVQSGNVHGAISDLIAASLFLEAGFEIRATSLTDGNQDLVVGAESGVENMDGLRGHTVGLSENTVMEYACDRILTHYNLDPDDDVVKNYIPQMTARMEMLRAGNVDSVVIPEPQISVATADGATVLASSNDLELHATCLVFLNEAIAGRADQIEAFYRAYNRAIDYLTTHDVSEYIDAVVKETGFPEEVTDSLTLPDYVAARAPEASDIDEINAWMVEKGLLKAAYTVEDVVDDQFVR